MERTHIQLSGITTHPEHTAGEMQQLVNLRKKNGSLIPVAPRKSIQTLSQSFSQIFIHSNSGYEHKIGVYNNAVYYLNGDTEPKLCDTTGSVKIEQIGNILIILSDSGLQFILWKDGEYKNISSFTDGTQTDSILNPKGLIEIKASGAYPSETTNYSKAKGYTYSQSSGDSNTTSETNLKLSHSLLLKAKAKVSEEGYLNGFHLAITAIELYDGSYICHSAPVLLNQAWDRYTRYSFNEYNYLTNPLNNGGYTSNSLPDGEYSVDLLTAGVSSLAHLNLRRFVYTGGECVGFADRQSLYFKIKQQIPEILNGIVTGVSIFISPEVLNFDLTQKYVGATEWPLLYKIKTNSELQKEISELSEFYKVYDITFDSLRNITPGVWTECDLKGKLGDNLYSQQELPLDPFSHHSISAELSYVYNQRLHLARYEQVVSRGWPLAYYKPAVDLDKFPRNNFTGSEPFNEWMSYIVYHIRTGYGIAKVVRYLNTQFEIGDLSSIISYPDSRAFKAEIYQRAFTQNYYYYNITQLDLTPNAIHNYSSYISGDLKPIVCTYNGGPKVYFTGDSIPSEENREIKINNLMKVSGLNNPFVFPNANTYTIGNGKIMAFSANALKVSEGQFGQFPIYVLTDNGIYAMQIGSGEVVYSNVSPISFEMPVSSVVGQTPFGTIFITQKGLMTINGQNVDFISPQLEMEPESITLESLPLDLGAGLNPFHIHSINPLAYIHGAEYILFNPHENEIIIRDTNSSYTLVYNLQAKMFYYSTENFNSVVSNNYPELHVISGASIKDYGQKQADSAEIALILRPLRFASNDLKYINRIKLRANLMNNTSDLYVMHHSSGDGYNFKLVRGIKNTLRNKNFRDFDLGLMGGNKNKYFTFAFAGKLDDDSRINSIEVEVEKVYNNDKMI